MQQGFVLIHRTLMEHGVWQDPYYLKLWMYCIMKASHKEREQLVGNQLVKIDRGEFVTGRFSLTDEMNRGMKPEQQKNESTWWRYLKNLEKWGMLHIKSNNKFSVVTLDKYDFYQQVGGQSEQQTAQQLNNNCTPNEQQLPTNKELNNDKELNNVNKKNPYSNEFERFWSIYPRKVNKKQAYTKFKAAIKRHPLEKILDGTQKYADQSIGKALDYIKHPSTFLHNDSFIDGFEEPRQVQKQRGQVVSLFQQGEESKKRQKAAEESVNEETMAELEKLLEEMPF